MADELTTIVKCDTRDDFWQLVIYSCVTNR